MKEIIELRGHIIDSLILPKILDTIMDARGSFDIVELKVGKTKVDESYAKIEVSGAEDLFEELERLGAILPKKEVVTVPAPAYGILPDDFYGTTNHPTFVYLNKKWVEVQDIEMDCVITLNRKTGEAFCVRQGLVNKGDEVVVGFSGVKIEAPQRSREPSGIFGFMSSEISPEKPILAYTQKIALEMKNIKDKKGFIIYVLGTAIAHTGADNAIANLVRMGYVQAIFIGNGFATMDVEKSLFGTTLGMDEKTGKVLRRGYESHLVAINEIRKAGSIKAAVEKGIVKKGVQYECVKRGIPVVIGGSVRDDGPMPDTITDVMTAQDEMRKHVRKADMCIIAASMLHGIATGNILPSRVKTICIDINPYVVTRLQDRGTTQAIGIVSDPAIVIPLIAEELERLESEENSKKTVISGAVV